MTCLTILKRIYCPPPQMEIKVPKTCEVACLLKMKKSDKDAFVRAIDDDYRVHWSVDNLPVGTYVIILGHIRHIIFSYQKSQITNYWPFPCIYCMFVAIRESRTFRNLSVKIRIYDLFCKNLPSWEWRTRHRWQKRNCSVFFSSVVTLHFLPLPSARMNVPRLTVVYS